MDYYLSSNRKQFAYYKSLGDRTFKQLSEEQLFWAPHEDSNSIGQIVKHMHGNMLSRWTDFLTSDGEKQWRERDTEFENDILSKDTLLEKWEEGWNCLFNAINPLTDEQCHQLVYIRNMGHTVTEAINRQLCHYAYHVGQIVFLGKLLAEKKWHSLSIPKGQSEVYNTEKFAKPKRIEHFTNDL